MSVPIRSAREADAAAIAEIYNEGIEDGQATFETRPHGGADFTDAMGEGAPPFLVAEDQGRLVGWARLGPYSSRACYDGVAEASVYIRRAARGRGLGRLLMQALADEAARRG